MRKETRQKWVERIREWRASGLSAADYAAGKDFEASALRWAVRKLELQRPSASTAERNSGPKQRRGRAERDRSPIPQFLPVRMGRSEPVLAEMVVEVGGARIRVSRGVDVALLGDVVRALQGVGR
jgi:transposase